MKIELFGIEIIIRKARKQIPDGMPTNPIAVCGEGCGWAPYVKGSDEKPWSRVMPLRVCKKCGSKPQVSAHTIKHTVHIECGRGGSLLGNPCYREAHSVSAEFYDMWQASRDWNDLNRPGGKVKK